MICCLEKGKRDYADRYSFNTGLGWPGKRVPEKYGGLLRSGTEPKAWFEMIAMEKPNFPVARMCAWAGVSESGLYAWQKREPSATASRRSALATEIRRVHEVTNGTAGYRKVHA